MSPLTTHVLDLAEGRPARGVPVRLEFATSDNCETWRELARAVTDDDGRVTGLLAPGALVAGIYRLTFTTEAYWRARGVNSFYPFAAVVFRVTETARHHHVPLLISPHGYSTYRGS